MALDALGLIDGNGRGCDSASLPRALVTGTGLDPRPRLRVDTGQTSFFEGREFRAFTELALAAGAVVSFRFTSPIDFILQKQGLALRTGDLRFEVYSSVNPLTGASTPVVPAGVWTALPTQLGKNRMSDRPLPLYTKQCDIATGGTFTGGSLVDLVLLSAQSNGNQINTVGSVDTDARGLPATVFYGRFTNVGASALSGVYYLEWEERQAASAIIT